MAELSPEDRAFLVKIGQIPADEVAVTPPAPTTKEEVNPDGDLS